LSETSGSGVLKEYPVWDRTQRVSHWITFVSVLTLIAIGTVILTADALEIPDVPGMVLLKTTHVWVGYVFAVNLAWRIVWAFVGGPNARCRALLPGGRGYFRRAKDFIAGYVRGDPPFYLGHDPLGRVFLTLLLVLLIVQALTGLVLAGTDVYMPPLGGVMRDWVAGTTHDPALVQPYSPETVDPEAYADMRAFRAPIVEIHELNFYVLVVLIAIHITAAVVTELREGGTIISAMFTGRKAHRRRPVDLEP
jgi:Ni/Fe-hydrogenase 1 B-type cytochrome subunit